MCIKHRSSSLCSSSKLYLLSRASLKENLLFSAFESTMITPKALKALAYKCQSLDVAISDLTSVILQKK